MKPSAQFKRLRDDPVNAAKELDRTLHFLTATQLEQIRVLGRAGKSGWMPRKLPCPRIRKK
ncbi:tail protein [Salmonella enterica subsp. enterica]|nr:tail protein [Salmonella enterica subsp. enterica]